MNLPSLHRGDLQLNVATDANNVVTLSWLGRSDARDPGEFLNPYLQKLAKDVATRELVVDFRRLDYMNSSTVVPIITFVKALDAQNVKALVLYNSQRSWQQMSFDALKTVCSLLRNVTVRGETLDSNDRKAS